MTPKTSFKDILKIFGDKNCKLLLDEKDFKSKTQKVSWECLKCHNIRQTQIKGFSECKICDKPKYKKRKSKFIYEYVYKQFENEGCKLITTKEEYNVLYNQNKFKGPRQSIDWMCRCQMNKTSPKIENSSFDCFKSYKRCRKCGIKSVKSTGTYDDFCDLLVTEEWTMISPKSEYQNTKTIMNVLTKTGYKTKTSYNRFQQGHRAKIDKDNSERKSHEKAVIDFVEKGFILVGKYINNRDLNEVKCQKGHLFKISYRNMKTNVTGCPVCFKIKYGCPYSIKSKYFRKRMIEIYGTEHAAQVDEIFKRMQESAFSTKMYKFPSGRIDQIQGYEYLCLDYLIHKEKIPEEDIVTGCESMPKIWYTFKNKKCRYYPDIFIPKQNRLVEVKSTYTYQLDKEKNHAKWKKASKKYQFEVYIYDGKKQLVEEWIYKRNDSNNNLLILKFSEM